MNLTARCHGNGIVHQAQANEFTLALGDTESGHYHLAQLDDYGGLPRHQFPWRAPFTLSLSSRITTQNFNGTWGFGLWNDPFSISIGLKGGSRHIPTLPNTVWFFFGGPQNHLSFRNDLPANGMLAGTFQSKKLSPLLLAPAGLGLPLLALKPFARLARKIATKVVSEDAVACNYDWTERHDFKIEAQSNQVVFSIDQQEIFRTSNLPLSPLGLVIWIDNQYAAFPPDGKLAFGTVATSITQLEIQNLAITSNA